MQLMYIEEQARGIIVQACRGAIKHRLIAANNPKRRETEAEII